MYYLTYRIRDKEVSLRGVELGDLAEIVETMEALGYPWKIEYWPIN